jgi:hypothetical protein
VTFAGRVAGRSVVVVRQPGGLKVTYEPVRPAVEAGQRVSAGSVLGILERVASHCAPATCLHVGVRRGGAYVDPLPFFGPRQVRLKPLGGGHASTPGGTSPGRLSGDTTGHDVASEDEAFGRSGPSSGATSRVAAGALVTVAAGAAAAAAVRRRQARG